MKKETVLIAARSLSTMMTEKDVKMVSLLLRKERNLSGILIFTRIWF